MDEDTDEIFHSIHKNIQQCIHILDKSNQHIEEIKQMLDVIKKHLKKTNDILYK